MDQNITPKRTATSQKPSKIPRVRASMDNKDTKRKHNFNPNSEPRDTSRDRSHSANRKYDNPTESSKYRNYLNLRKSHDLPREDIDEHESMEMQPPLPHNKPRGEASKSPENITDMEAKIR